MGWEGYVFGAIALCCFGFFGYLYDPFARSSAEAIQRAIIDERIGRLVSVVDEENQKPRGDL